MNKIASIAGGLACLVLAVDIVRPDLRTGVLGMLRRLLARRA